MYLTSAFVLQYALERDLVSRHALATVRGKIESGGGSGTSCSDDVLLTELTAHGLLDGNQVTLALAEDYDLEVADLEGVLVEKEALACLPREAAERYGILPLAVEGEQLTIVGSDPLDTDMVDSLTHLLGMSIEFQLASPVAIEEAIERHYGADLAGEIDVLGGEFGVGEGNLVSAVAAGGASPGGDVGDEGPINRYVQKLVTEAVKRRASDIHMEPLERRFRVRFRIDGVLSEVENPPKRLQLPIVSRLKLMANISIAEKRIPQDGRIEIKVDGKQLDLRVSSLPTAHGESVVMRILDKEGLRMGLPRLGFLSDDQAVFERLITLADGILLVTGPTGSGKSTTLYACLHYLNQPDRKIITVEDPVEYQITGINQVQVRRNVGMSFAAALRAMMRQAPNIIMIGEIRDLETAEIAVNASLTGHLVFSTLHTNDASGAVSRLIDLGVKPFLVSASLRAAMAQRLVRVNCPACAASYQPEAWEIRAIGLAETAIEGATFMKGTGCPDCHGRGYFGRRGIFEILVVDDEIREMIYENASLIDLRQKARELGMRTLREDGIRKVTSGLTTIEELLSVTVE